MRKIGIFNQFKVKKNEQVIPNSGQLSSPSVNDNVKKINGYKIRTNHLLRHLRSTADVYKAIELITTQHPDASMALTSMLRIANSGNSMEFYDDKDNRDIKAEGEWREVCQRINSISNDGLDGLINQFHKSAILYGGMACETVVTDDLSDIQDVYPILPQSITWELEKRNNIDVWVPYQQQINSKVDLTQGNFQWVALDPDVGKPTGSLMFESALQPIDYQLQFMEDLNAVVRVVGYPKYDFEIDREAVIKSLPPNIRNSPTETISYMRTYFDKIKEMFRSLSPTDASIHYSDIKSSKMGVSGGNSIDVRACYDVIDPQVMNGLKCLSVLLNRTTGITESWGTVQFQIVIKTVESLQRGSKRLIENMARIWLQTKGYSLVSKFNHNPVDWETELKKLETKIAKQKLYRQAEEYDYIDKLTAARETMGVSKLPKPQVKGKYQYLNKILNETTSGK